MDRFHIDPFNSSNPEELISTADQYALNGQFAQAQDCYLKAIHLNPSISLRNDYALFLRNFGYPEKAVVELKQLHQESLWKQDREKHIAICENLCCCYLEMGQQKEAEVFHHQAMAWSECPTITLLMRSMEFELSRKNWKEAEALLEDAFDLCQSTRDEANLLGHQGALLLARGKLMTAVPVFYKAYQFHQNENALEEAGTDLLNLAEISKYLGRVRSERRFLKKAVDLFQQSGVHWRNEELENRIKVLFVLEQLNLQKPEWN